MRVVLGEALPDIGIILFLGKIILEEKIGGNSICPKSILGTKRKTTHITLKKTFI